MESLSPPRPRNLLETPELTLEELGFSEFAKTLRPLASAAALRDLVRTGDPKEEFPIRCINAGATGALNIPSTGTGEVSGCMITVPPTDEDVVVRAQAVFQQTTIGAGQFYLYLCEGSAATQLTSWVAQLPNNITTTKYGQVTGKYRVGRSAVARHYHLRATATFACQVLATAFNPILLEASI